MRTLFYSILLLGLSASSGVAERSGLSVHLRPDSNSPVIGTLPANSPRVPPAEEVELTAEQKEKGWEAIAFQDNFRGHVRLSQVRKDLTITSGSPIYVSPSENPRNILAHAERRDVFEVGRVDGNWAEVSFRKPVTGYVRPGADAAPRSTEREGSRTDGDRARTEQSEVRDVPVADASQPRPRIPERAGTPTPGTLRAFEGYLSPTRSLFGRTQPYPHQIVDQSGNRIAYVDLSKLLITTPMDRLYGHQFEVYGRAEPLEGRRDFVIRVERMHRK